MARIGVITDSAASLPPELAEAHGIRVVPMQIIVDGAAYLEGVNITPAEVIAHLEAGRAVSTSQPSPAAFALAIEQERAAGAEAVVVVTLSSELSGTYASATAALAEALIPGTVVDSLTVAMAQGLAAMAAARAVAAGAGWDDAGRAARWTAERSTCVFTVESLDHLRRGGRIGPAVAAAGRVLGIRPVLAVESGRIVVHSRARSAARARAAMGVEIAAAVDAALADDVLVGVAVLDAGVPRDVPVPEAAATWVVRGPVSAVLVAHTGPGTVAAMAAPMAPWGGAGVASRG